MVLKNLVAKMSPVARSFSTTPNFAYSHAYRGIVGSNLPFQTDNRYRLLFVSIVYLSTGLGLPFFFLGQMVRAKNT